MLSEVSRSVHSFEAGIHTNTADGCHNPSSCIVVEHHLDYSNSVLLDAVVLHSQKDVIVGQTKQR